MKKLRQLDAACAVVFTLLTVTANAAFTGRPPITPGGSDWQAYYDEQPHITWPAMPISTHMNPRRPNISHKHNE